MQSSYIKEEPNLTDDLENKQNSIHKILTPRSNVAFQIKSEPIDDGFTTSESFINNSHRYISIIKEEVDISDENESDENILHDDNLEKNLMYNYCKTESINVKWPSKYKSTSKELNPSSTSENGISKNQRSISSKGIVSINNKSLKSNNLIVLKDVMVVLEKMPISKILGFKKAHSPENIDQDDINKKWSSFCKLHCSRCNKTIDATSTFKITKCRACKIAMFLQCRKCEKSYDRAKAMHNHLINRCYPRRKYNCAHCNFGTTIRNSIVLHMQRLHNENNQPVECPKCHKTFKSLYLFKKHQKLCKMEGRFSCTICPYKSHYKNGLMKHMASHERFNKLMQENRSNANVDSMIDDINSESITALMKCEILKNFERFCPQCNTTFENNIFNNKGSSNKFMYECHLCKIKLLLQCLKCNIRFDDVKRMKTHLLTKCALKKNYKCPECDYETVIKNSLKWHIKRWHTIIDPKEFEQCPKCNKSFRIMSDFKKHFKSCGIEQYNYHCDHCAFKTKSKKSMRKHAQTHTNTGKIKVKKNSRDPHVIKAYCSTCNVFRIAGPKSKMLCFMCKNLMTFKCRYCDEKAPTKKDIRLHESKKHGYVYHYCPNCDKAYLRPSNLKEHKKICKSAAAQKK